MLDPQGHVEVMEVVKKLHAKGFTIIYITHFMEEAIEADRVFVMESGKIIKVGAPREIFTDVEGIKKIGLDIPIAAEMAYRLRKRGFKLPKDILTAEDFAGVMQK